MDSQEYFDEEKSGEQTFGDTVNNLFHCVLYNIKYKYAKPNTMKMLPIMILIMALAAACNQESKREPDTGNTLDKVMDKVASEEKSDPKHDHGDPMGQIHRAVVVKAKDAGTYTYVKLEENGEQFWAAITARPVEIGKAYAYSGGMMMEDFESKQLGITFDSVMFIQNFDEASKSKSKSSAFQKSDPHAHTKTRLHNNIKVEPAKGGHTIAGIYSNLESLGGKEVTVKGKVVKISKNIMNRHWIHIQDGTQSGKHYDLTITTYEPVNFSVGAVVTFNGILSADKDFGAGYVYDAIVENASVEQYTSL